MRLLVQKAVYGKDGAHAGPATPPVAYEYRVVVVDDAPSCAWCERASEEEEPKVVLPADERVVAVLP